MPPNGEHTLKPGSQRASGAQAPPGVPPRLAVLGDFELRREIGRGGMGTVYEAWQRSLQRRVALKVLHSQISASSATVERFQREARAVAKLQHIHITSIHAQGEQDGVYYYVMEYVEGRSLSEIIAGAREVQRDDTTTVDLDETVVLDRSGIEPAARTSGGGKPAGIVSDVDTSSSTIAEVRPAAHHSPGETIPEIVRHIAAVADALDYAHSEGVIHRDIKPHNLILGNDARMKITDFGLARMVEQPGVTHTGEMLGSPLYMSPEQILGGRGRVDHRTDVYSLGATMYEWLTLSTPYPGETREQVISLVAGSEPVPLRALNPDIPLDLETICHKAIERERDRRYQSAGEFRDDLRRFLLDRPIRAKRVGVFARLGKYVARHQVASIIAAAVAIALVLGWALLTMRSEAGRRSTEAQQATAEALEAREQADRMLDAITPLLDVLPLEIGGLVSGAGAAPPVFQDIMAAGGRLSVTAGSVRSGGAKPEAVNTPEGIARRAARDLYNAFAAADGASAVQVSDAFTALFEQAISSWDADEPDKALTPLNAFLDVYRSHFEALQLRTAIHGRIGNYEKMALDAKGLIRLQADNPVAYVWSGLAHLLLGESDRALAYLRRAGEYRGSADWIAAIRGLLLIRMDQPAEAVALMGELPDLVVAILVRAVAHAAMNDQQSVVTDLSRVIRVEPDNADALAVRGLYYGAIGRFGEAAADFKRAMDIAGNTPQMNLQWLIALAQQRNAQSAPPVEDGEPTGPATGRQPSDDAGGASDQRVQEWFSRFVYPSSSETYEPDSISPPPAP